MLFCVLFLCAVSAARALPLPTDVVNNYLREYGYINESSIDSGLLEKDSDYSTSISAAQVEMGLEPSGLLDNATLALMTRPRCGNSPAFGGSSRRVRRFQLNGYRWRLTPVTWDITIYHPGMKRTFVDSVVEGALAEISSVSKLRFVRSTVAQPPADIKVKFVSAEHGCTQAMSGLTLAHAFNPFAGGDVHVWTDVNWNATRMDLVVAHELLHGLGLSHSQLPSSLMYAFYHDHDVPVGGPRLTADDVMGVQRLYGMPPSS